MDVIAKFRCMELLCREGNQKVKFTAASTLDLDNTTGSQHTPSGNLTITKPDCFGDLTMTITNPDCFGAFVPGQSYLLKITPFDKG